MDQVIQIPLEFLSAATYPGGPDNNAHILWNLQLGHGCLEFVTFFAFNSARNAPGSRIAGHKYKVASCEATEGRECGSFIASFFLLDLDNNFSAFLHNLGNIHLAFDF